LFEKFQIGTKAQLLVVQLRQDRTNNIVLSTVSDARRAGRRKKSARTSAGFRQAIKITRQYIVQVN
jgi:hypothetical protein